jgi:hypothetical protein
MEYEPIFKNLPKKLFLNSRKYDPGCSSRIQVLIFYPSRIQGSKRLLIRNTAFYSNACYDQVGNDLGNVEVVRPILKSPFDRNILTHFEGVGRSRR